MTHHCPFPVRSTDSRCGYRSGSVPCLTLCLALAAALLCFAGLGYAGGVAAPQEKQLDQAVGTMPVPSSRPEAGQ